MASAADAREESKPPRPLHELIDEMARVQDFEDNVETFIADKLRAFDELQAHWPNPATEAMKLDLIHSKLDPPVRNRIRREDLASTADLVERAVRWQGLMCRQCIITAFAPFKRPTVRIRFNGSEHRVEFDLGIHVNIASQSLYEDAKLAGYGFGDRFVPRVSTHGGGEIAVRAQVAKLKIRFGDVDMYADFVALPELNITSSILGATFLRNNDVEINCKRDRWNFDGRCFDYER